MPFAGLFGYDATENFNFCMKNIFHSNSAAVLGPVYGLMSSFTDIAGTISNSANSFRYLIANLLNTDSDLNRLTPVLLGKITNWKQIGSEIQAAPTKTTTKDYIEKVFTTVFNNAGVTYDLKK